MATAQPPAGDVSGAPRSTKATTILVLGILSIICCQLAGPIAWFLGRQELALIGAGSVSAQDETTVKIGMILGIIASVLLMLGLIWVIFLGGLASLGALAGQAGM